MNGYQLKLQPPARRSLRKTMPENLSQEAAEIILALSEDPYPPYSANLERELQGRRKIRVDGWRIIYSVNEDDRIITVWDIRPRNARTYLNVP